MSQTWIFYWYLLGLTIQSVMGQYIASRQANNQNSNYVQQQQTQYVMQPVGGYGQFNAHSSTGPAASVSDQQQHHGFGQTSTGSGYGGGGRVGQLHDSGSSGRGLDNGNPLNKLNPNYLGPRSDYCKRPTGQFSVANDCTSFYNCHEVIFNLIRKTAQCDYAEVVGCAAAAAAASASANAVQNNNGGSSNVNNQQPNPPSVNSGYGATGFQAQYTPMPMQNNVNQGNQQQQPSNSGYGGTGFQSQVRDNQAPLLQGGGGGWTQRSLPSNPGNDGKVTWGNDGGFNQQPRDPQNQMSNPGNMAVVNQPPNVPILNIQPPLTRCIEPNAIPVDSVRPPNGNAMNEVRPIQRNDGPQQNQLGGDDRGFPVIQARQVPGQTQPGMRPDETDNNDYSTLYSSNGPKIGRIPCQPCQQQGVSCPAYPEAKCFDDVCGGCRARFFIRRSGGSTPFAEVTQLCGGNPSASASQPDNNAMNNNAGNANNNQQQLQEMIPKNGGLNQPY